jgi:hypothetical protein
VSADLAGPSPIAEIGREQCSKDDGAGYVLSSNDNGAGQQELRGRCSAWLGGAAFFFDVHWQLSHVPALGSCCIIAIVRAVANLNVQAIKEIVADSFNWVDVEAKLTKWAAYGKEDDPNAKCFREYAFRFMLDNHDNIAKHLDRDPDIEGDGDITPKQFVSARNHAHQLLGSALPTKKAMTRVQKWAVAVLCCSTHFTEEIVKALLHVDLGGWLGILVATSNLDGVVRILHYQPWIFSGNKVLIAVLHESKQQHLEDNVVLESISLRQRACKSWTCAQEPLKILSSDAAAAAAAREEGQRAMDQKKAAKMNKAVFKQSYNIHHYSQVTILNGHGGALSTLNVSATSEPATDDNGGVGGDEPGGGGDVDSMGGEKAEEAGGAATEAGGTIGSDGAGGARRPVSAAPQPAAARDPAGPPPPAMAAASSEAGGGPGGKRRRCVDMYM